MKNTLRFFAFLDILSIMMLSKQIFSIITNLSQVPDEAFSKIRIALLLLIYLLLFISASGLLLFKKWGAVAYYLQFPFRLMVWVFSFGFLTLLNEYTRTDVFDWLFRIIIIAEFLRLYFTATIQRRYL